MQPATISMFKWALMLEQEREAEPVGAGRWSQVTLRIHNLKVRQFPEFCLCQPAVIPGLNRKPSLVAAIKQRRDTGPHRPTAPL